MDISRNLLLAAIVVASGCGDGAVESPQTTALCCATPDACYEGVASASDCDRLFGVVGAAGTVCDGATGRCQAAPVSPGPCCELPELDICLTSPTLPLDLCVDAGGDAFASGTRCRPDGTCAGA